ncbi:MAG: phosphogluconate dehydratase [Gammaproteobacteria bacterium]|nr:phosphogluconate dehydratase [Gammaproteobacteria bacterium]
MEQNLHPTITEVTQRIIQRSVPTRGDYMARMTQEIEQGVKRSSLSCGNMAHACAAAELKEKLLYVNEQSPNIGIVTAYNDMLSAHQPYKDYPDHIKRIAIKQGATAQVAGGVPAMCDGVTQGQNGMELSLFSRDVIAMSATVALSHQCFDAAIFLGICDKIIPGLTIAAASFGHLPSIMIPAGPMTSGLPNEEKSESRKAYVAGKIDKSELLKAEMASYHSPGTCTFYGTANTNQLIMEIMGLQLPGSSFVNPMTQNREALTIAAVEQLLTLVKSGNEFTPVCEILSEKNFVNGIVGLLASGGSTNLVIHMVAMARAAGVILDLQDFSDLSAIVPMISRVYSNGWADINAFQDAGGMPVFIAQLLEHGLLHRDVTTVAGKSLEDYTRVPEVVQGKTQWSIQKIQSSNPDVLGSVERPFAKTGGLVVLDGNIGRAVFKTSSLKPEQMIVNAPAKVFHSQQQVMDASKSGELDCDLVCVVCFQGPKANGMPELHNLLPMLSNIEAKGFKVALVTDGRMSGASGKIPSAIHVSPEAASGGLIGAIRDGDIITIDGNRGTLSVNASDLSDRAKTTTDLSANQIGCGRELFTGFRDRVGSAEDGASVLF